MNEAQDTFRWFLKRVQVDPAASRLTVDTMTKGARHYINIRYGKRTVMIKIGGSSPVTSWTLIENKKMVAQGVKLDRHIIDRVLYAHPYTPAGEVRAWFGPKDLDDLDSDKRYYLTEWRTDPDGHWHFFREIGKRKDRRDVLYYHPQAVFTN